MSSPTKAHRELLASAIQSWHSSNLTFQETMLKLLTDLEFAAYARGLADGAESWIRFDAESGKADSDCPVAEILVQYNTHDGPTVGYRRDDGTWFDPFDHGYRDNHVTHWAPLLPSPRDGR